ncbi:MAG: HD-GYP domain-containing protein [Bacillota bacterium]
MRLAPVNCVQEGNILAKTLYDRDGRVLLNRGVVLNKGILQKIEENQIFTIYIDDEFSTNEIEDVISPQIRTTATKSIKDTFDHFEKYNESLRENNSVKAKQLLKSRDNYVQVLNRISKNIVDEITTSKNIMLSMVDIKNLDTYTYQHSVNVAILSLVLGIELQLNRNELYDLCMGALLHDIGMAFVPKKIVTKRGTLTAEEEAIIREHPMRGYEYLKDDIAMPAHAKVIALQHHEKIDGTGYPRKTKGDSINKLAKIVAVADVYDALTSDRPYKKSIPPSEAIEYIMGGAGTHFDFKIAETFVRKVVPYPVGTLVKLSDGNFGVIEQVHPNYPLRPVVKVIKQKAVTVDMVSVDLLKETNLVIEGIQYETPNLSVQNYLKNK